SNETFESESTTDSNLVNGVKEISESSSEIITSTFVEKEIINDEKSSSQDIIEKIHDEKGINQKDIDSSDKNLEQNSLTLNKKLENGVKSKNESKNEISDATPVATTIKGKDTSSELSNDD